MTLQDAASDAARGTAIRELDVCDSGTEAAPTAGSSAPLPHSPAASRRRFSLAPRAHKAPRDAPDAVFALRPARASSPCPPSCSWLVVLNKATTQARHVARHHVRPKRAHQIASGRASRGGVAAAAVALGHHCIIRPRRRGRTAENATGSGMRVRAQSRPRSPAYSLPPWVGASRCSPLRPRLAFPPQSMRRHSAYAATRHPEASLERSQAAARQLLVNL